MKRFIVFLSVIFFSFTSSAQTDKKVNQEEKRLNIDVGPMVAVPLKNFNMFSTFGIGADGAVTYKLGKGFAVGGRLNYGYFFGRSADPAFTGGEDHYKASNLFNVLAEVNYKFDNQILLGLDLGLGLLSFNGYTDAAFAQKVYAGYQWNREAHPFIFYLFYEQTITHKSIGISANIRL